MMGSRTLRLFSALSALLVLSACATTGGPMNPDQKIVADYTAEYVGAGIGIGAIVGCGLGALLSKKNAGKGCAVGAAVVGATGAGLGVYAARSQGQRADESAAIAANQDAVNAEIARTRQVSAAAERMAISARTDITSLRQRVAMGQASQQQLVARVAQVNRDRASLDKVAQNLRGEIAQTNAVIEKNVFSDAEVARLVSARNELQRELARIEQAISTMQMEAGAAGV